MSVGIDPKKVQRYLEEVEFIAEDILSDKEEIISLDKRRNTNREAVQQLRTNENSKHSTNSWICVGNMFMRLPKTAVLSSIEKEQKQLDNEINSLRNGLRKKVDKLNEVEGKEKTRGSGLTALSKEEWNGIKQVLGQ